MTKNGDKMETIYFTDAGAGLTRSRAEKLGIVLVPSNLVFCGEPIEDRDGVILDDEFVQNSFPNAEQFKDVFDKYAGKNLVYITYAQATREPTTLDQIRAMKIPNLAIIDSGLICIGQTEFCKQFMRGQKPKIQMYFVVRNPRTKIFPNLVPDKFNLYTFDAGGYKHLRTFDTRFAAMARLRKLCNSQIETRANLNGTMGLHCGADYLGGIRS